MILFRHIRVADQQYRRFIRRDRRPLALFFRYRMFAGRPKGKDGERPSWGGEMTAADRGPGGAGAAAARGAQAALWYKLVLVSLGMAALANIAGRIGGLE